MADVFVFRVTRPGGVLLVGLQGSADRVHAAHNIGAVTESVQHARANACHDVHTGQNVGRIRDLEADFRDRSSNRTHAVGNHVHGSSNHRTGIELGEPGLHLGRIFPVVGGTGILPVVRTNESAVFHTGNVGGIGTNQDAVGTFFGIQGNGNAA